MINELKTRYNKSLNSKPPRLDKQEEDDIRKELDDIINEHREEEMMRQEAYLRQETYKKRKMGTNQSWKKKLQTDTSYESLLDLKEESFIWNTPYAAEFLSPEKLAELNY